MSPHPLDFKTRLATVVALAWALQSLSPAHAAETDIANAPLFTSSVSSVKSNIMFIFDDSGSMGWEYLPDNLPAWERYARNTYQCNGVAYNPDITYTVPLKADGSDYDAMTLAAARSNGFSSTAKSAIPTNWLTYYRYTGSQKALSYTYSGSNFITSTDFYKECNSTIGSTPGSAVFTPVDISTQSSAQQVNYANWYSYYRNRLLTMKSSVGLAFATVDSKYRVGFNLIGNRSASGTKFLDIKDFDSTQKTAFYSQLYSVAANGYTPLRAALSRAGQYYANAAPSQSSDPVQYSCQKNFTILSTDGYWNTNEESSTDPKFGPYKVDNITDVGQQDGNAARPMYDGGAENLQIRTSTLQSQTTAMQLQSRTSSLQLRSITTLVAPSIQRRTSTDYGYNWTSWVDVTACTADNKGSNRTQCQFPKSTSSDSGASWSAWFYDNSCSPDSSGRSQTQCSGSVSNYGNWGNAASCTVSSTTECQYTNWTFWNNASACTAQAPSGSSPFTVGTATECQTIQVVGAWTNTSACTVASNVSCQYTGWTAWSNTSACTAAEQSSGPNYTVGTAAQCQTASVGGSTNSLADVAMYYYKTDLRDAGLSNCTGALGSNVCANNVAGVGRDVATHQHMTSFTLGMGINGTLTYDANYLSQTAGDYFSITQGPKNWPIPDGNAANVDDLWHAAVNGRGQYFSASKPEELVSGLNNALNSIKAITGAASAAATSALQPVQGDNDIYVAQFTSVKWTGDVSSYKIEPATGVVSTTATWSAQTQLDAITPASRKIYYPRSGSLREFTYANLSADGLQGNFDNFCSKTGADGSSTPAQCVSMNSSNNTLANSGTNLVNYLRGASTYADDAVYRAREHVMGDVINASPLFVGKPAFKYTENGYADFAKNSTRGAIIYAASNDGMLHALDQATGIEKWAYIPSFVMSKMYKLGDTNYANNHQFLVDGSPVMADVYVDSAWKTILIGGLNSGGRGYYALDITNPASPSLLWEFSNDDLGYTYGNPIVTKKSDGTWVVLFASGYNNVSPGDGNGHLFMLNATTGVLEQKISTLASGSAVGSTSTPSGLAKINVYVESDTENLAKLVYAGDLLGNVWRFDINSTLKPYLSAMQLAELKVGTTAQPITTRPALADVSYNGAKYHVVYVGTGKYLGTSDLANTDVQTIYALKDTWTETGLGNVRTATSPAMVVQNGSATTSVSQGSIVTGTTRSVNWTTDAGWYLDLIGSGERVSVSPLLVLNALYVGTNIPSNDACTVGGTSWLYKLDIAKGSAIAGATENALATSLGNVLIMGLTNVQLTTKNVATIVTRSDGTLSTVVGAQPSSSGAKRRTSWRVLK